jgi:hypothetical protein
VTSAAWTVSIGSDGDRWGVYYEGRLVLDGYEQPAEASWAATFLARGRRPPYVPEGAEVQWPGHHTDTAYES